MIPLQLVNFIHHIGSGLNNSAHARDFKCIALDLEHQCVVLTYREGVYPTRHVPLSNVASYVPATLSEKATQLNEAASREETHPKAKKAK